MFTLKGEKRNIGKANLLELREKGKIPAVFYGKGIESTSVSVLISDFKKVWKEAGSSSLISLTGIGDDLEVMIQSVDVDPVSGQVQNIDFRIIERGKLMEAEIPLEFVGVSPAIKNLGGVLVKVIHEMKIEVLPKDLPHQVIVDISSLEELNSQIMIKDLNLPEGVVALNDPEDVVVAISQAVEEEEVEQPVDISEVEIEKKGKKDESESEE